MAVKIGHASIDENSSAKGGAAGDQTLKEVCTRTWYNKPWTAVFRPKDSTAAEKIAKAMEQACANDKIGYDQAQRTTLYTYAKAAGWDLSKITTACECDCSALVAVCVNAAGIAVSKNMYTGNEKSVLSSTGKFDVLTSSKYIGSSDYLKRGDILLGVGHTAIVLSDGSGAGSSTSTETTATPKSKKATEYARSGPDKSLAGTYTVKAFLLNIRNGAGTTANRFGKNKSVLVTIPKGTKVKCYGYYTEVNGTKWLNVLFTYKGVSYTGFASSKWMVKQ